MTKPVRIQRKRTKGYNMQAHSRSINGLDCVYVGRPSRYGNPFKIKDCIDAGYAKTKLDAALECQNAYRSWLYSSGEWFHLDQAKRYEILGNLKNLKGKNLACFCPTDKPSFCHADVLLQLANNRSK